jgi:hypothetical protein
VTSAVYVKPTEQKKRPQAIAPIREGAKPQRHREF